MTRGSPMSLSRALATLTKAADVCRLVGLAILVVGGLYGCCIFVTAPAQTVVPGVALLLFSPCAVIGVTTYLLAASIEKRRFWAVVVLLCTCGLTTLATIGVVALVAVFLLARSYVQPGPADCITTALMIGLAVLTIIAIVHLSRAARVIRDREFWLEGPQGFEPVMPTATPSDAPQPPAPYPGADSLDR